MGNRQDAAGPRTAVAVGAVEARVKGIVLAGGSGTRLAPITRGVGKQLLPVYDKPMVYHPLSSLLLAGVREILVVASPDDAASFRRLLGDGARWGVAIEHAVQAAPRGIAEAFAIARGFLAGSASVLVLGDNLLFGAGVGGALEALAAPLPTGARAFGVRVQDPRAYGVVAFDGDRVAGLVEKPAVPPSPYAVPGFYAVDGTAPDRVASQRPSARGELEIVDLLESYRAEGALTVTRLGRGVAWMDMGSPDALLEASSFVAAVQGRQGTLVGSPEEVAWRRGWIDDDALRAAAAAHRGTTYGARLAALVEEGR